MKAYVPTILIVTILYFQLGETAKGLKVSMPDFERQERKFKKRYVRGIIRLLIDATPAVTDVLARIRSSQRRKLTNNSARGTLQ